MTQTVPSKFVVLAVGVAMCVGVLLGGYRERTHPTARGATPGRVAKIDGANPTVWKEGDGPPRAGAVRWRGGVEDGYREVYLPTQPRADSEPRESKWHRVTSAPDIRAGERLVRVVLLAEQINGLAVAYVVLEDDRAVPMMHVVEPGP